MWPSQPTDRYSEHRARLEHRPRSDGPHEYQTFEETTYIVRNEEEPEWASRRAHHGRFLPTAPYRHPSDVARSPSPANAAVKRRDRIEDTQLDPLGLTVLHEPDGIPLADLVFVHSLGGGSIRTWSDDDQPGTFWPHWLSQETLVQSARISTYGYHSQVTATDTDRFLDLSDLAKDLLAKLRFGQGPEGRSLNVGDVPLIFVAHSLGGLIAKKAYILAMADPNSTYGEIAHATAAFIFFSTPHRGLHKGPLINDILSACVAGWRSTSNSEMMKKHTLKLQDINERFRDILTPLDIYSFYARPTSQAQGFASLALPQSCTTLDHPNETEIPLNADHISMTKYTSRNDPNYHVVKGALRYLVDKFQSWGKRAAIPEDTVNQAAEVSQMLHGCDAPSDDLSFFSDKRIDGSCEWVLDETAFESFLTTDEHSPQVLWAFGSAGSGKSVTATYVIEHLLEHSKHCSYYYFRSGHQVKNSLSRFLASIAHQISKFIPEYRRKLAALAADRFDVEKAGHKLLWKKLFVSALLQCTVRTPFYIVVDGLDELAYAKELLQKMFVDLGDSSIRLRLLLVSRPTLDVETSIERLSRRIRVQRVALDCNADDLALYVRDELDIMMGDDAFKERIVKSILSKAGRNFLWAHLVVQEVLECQTEVQVESALQQVPKELEPLYERMDKRIADMFRSRPQDLTMGHTIIMWATCARRSLHLDEIRSALEYDFPRILDMRQTVQRLCGEFVHVDKAGRVAMMHASAREFLMSNSRLNYYVNAHRANHALFTRCIQALTTTQRGRSHLDEPPDAFVAYAASSWPFHLTQSSDYGDQYSLSIALKLFDNHAVLDWMRVLADAGNLRAVVDASKAASKFLKTLDRADSERSPLTHRIADKETLHLWSQDLIRVVGKFGLQILRQPRTVYDLMPAFCPTDSMLHKQFAPKRRNNEPSLTVRGNLKPSWDDCFAKFAVPGESLPHSIMSMDRYFAILTKEDGMVHLYYSSTCDVARRLHHRELVMAWCVDTSIKRIATCGFRKTKVWDIESGRLVLSIDNPRRTKALAISFQSDSFGNEKLVTFSDDRVARSCSLESVRVEWNICGSPLDDEVSKAYHVNSPHNAHFSADGLYLAVSYRGANASVWYMGNASPRFMGHCDQRTRNSSSHVHQHTRLLYVQDCTWNPLTGHLLGVFNDGLIFKWHPIEDDFTLSDYKCDVIKCSADGKLFATGTGDGTLRIWDFEHFTPIYQLRYPLRIQALDLGWNEARVYDLRDQYCNIWEPSSLLRAMQSDDVSSDTQSSKDSENPSLASEAMQEQQDFEPITAFSTDFGRSIYAIGDDSGRITVSTFDGASLLKAEESFMSIERLAWSRENDLLADVDLGREIHIRRITTTALHGRQRSATSNTLRSCSEDEEVVQLLFDLSGERLMIVTPSHVKVHKTMDASPGLVVPIAKPSKWVAHPNDRNSILAFSPDQVDITSWNNLLDNTRLAYEPVIGKAPALDQHSMRIPNPRRPSEAYPTSPSELDRTVNKVLFSPLSELIYIEIYGATKQTRRRVECWLLEAKHLLAGRAAQTVPVCPLPPNITEALNAALGFIDIEPSIVPGRVSASDHKRPVPRRQQGQSTFAFIDKEFWICSADISFGQTADAQIRRHFFLPRDWQNSEALEMATVTAAGDFLCPRNGDVAVVSNGFLEEFRLETKGQAKVGPSK